MLLHLPPMEGHGEGPRAKNGPALAGHGAEAVRDAIAAIICTLPDQLRRSPTWTKERRWPGTLNSGSRPGLLSTSATHTAHCKSPWQRGTNENTNGLLRRYFPKGTDLTRHSTDDLAAIVDALKAGLPRHLTGGPPQKPSMICYFPTNKPGVATTR